MATREVPRYRLKERRRLVAAAVEDEVAAVRETAFLKHARQRRHLPPDNRELAGTPLWRRKRSEKLLRVRVLGRAEKRFALGQLDDLSGIHDGNAVSHARDDAQIMGNQQERHPSLGLQLGEEIEDLRLDGHVE